MPEAKEREELAEALRSVRELSDALQAKADELAAERQLYLEWFEHSPEPCLIVDEEGCILSVNQAFTELARACARRPKPAWQRNRTG